MTLYELLTLQRPFDTKQSALEANPTPPRSINRELDRQLEAIVLKALRKNPDDRYPSARALGDDLNHWLRREPVSVWPSQKFLRPFWRVWLWSKRNTGWSVAIALVLIGCLSLGVYAEERRQHAVEREKATERQLQLLDLQRTRQSDHLQDWPQTMWRRIAEMPWKPEERGAVQIQDVSSLSGMDTRTSKPFPIYARSLDATFACTLPPDRPRFRGRTPRPSALSSGVTTPSAKPGSGRGSTLEVNLSISS